MSKLGTLAKDTVIYGLSSIVGRFFNYLLVPVYTYTLKTCADYGIINDLYSWVALALVILTFGMETTFFRFANRMSQDEGEGFDFRSVFSTSFSLVSGVSLIFLTLGLLALHPIASALGYGNHPWYLGMMMIIVMMDATQAILFSLLRYQRRPLKFAAFKLIFIALNLTLNILAFVTLPKYLSDWSISVGYAFLINLICTGFIMLLFIPDLAKNFSPRAFSKDLAKRMLRYTWPILILGIAGILNQVSGQIMLPRLLPIEEGRTALGIYGACLKVAMIMALITQAFRYAYEPLVFAGAKDKNNPELMAKTMKFFIIFTLLAFLGVMGYMDILKMVIGSNYHEGLGIVPVCMVAEILMGIYFNLSFWYKLTDRTIYGTYFSLAGCATLILVNVLCIPYFGYWSCAWAGVAGYGVCVLLSYCFGQHFMPINYPLKSIAIYILITALFFAGMIWTAHNINNVWVRLTINTLFIGAFIGHLLYHDILPLWKQRHSKTA